MKPEKLILSGWGPYKDKIEIDFTGLEDRGLFLITGATGAGKTTIFDAITYALYGNMSGETREKNSVRSDFADGDTATFAELTMQHGGKEYRIVRNPEYMRPKRKRGGKKDYTKEKEHAVLYFPDGSAIEGSSEVNRKIQEILVLDYRQFKQISMIAQGEFARLLTASPAEKTRIFRELFSTSVYDRFAGILKNRSGELYRQVMECKNRMEEDLHMLRTDEKRDGGELLRQEAGEGRNYAQIIEELEEAAKAARDGLAVAEKKYSACEKEVVALTEAITSAEQMNEKLQKLSALKERQKDLKANKKAVNEMELELKTARTAAALKEDYVNLKNADDLLSAMKEKAKQRRKELDAYREKEKEIRPYYEKKEGITEAYELMSACGETGRRLKEMNARLEKKQKELCKLREQYVKQEEAAEKRKQEFETADMAYKRAVVGIAARQLRAGEPCPVCGSLTHPHAAAAAKEVPDEEGLRKLQKIYEQERERLMDIHGRTGICQGEETELTTRQKELDGQAREYREQAERIGEGIRQVIEGMSREAYEKILNDYRRMKAQTEEKQSQLAGEEGELEKQEEKKKLLEETFAQKYREAGFRSLKAYEESLRQEKSLEKMEKQIKDYYAELQQQENLISHLKEETKGRQISDVEGLKEQLKEKNARKQQALAALNESNHRQQEMKKVLKSLKDKEKQLTALSREYGIVKDLDNMASGNNARRLVFEQYVLAGYFEEILLAANLRLAKMTDGRYELSRMQEISDGRTKDNLEMQVFDYYTGKYRSVKTLSGGEAFKTSLALALGMSDVVQGYSGGIRVDTLFIDEGFGALDSESLDQACRTLMSLVEKDRLIGIISHVPELSEKIEKQIIITKTNVGSRVKVVV